MTETADDPYYIEICNAEITIDDDAWLSCAQLRHNLQRVLRDESCSILLTNDEHVRQLNKDFRAMDKPTNVLSFPAEDNDDDDYLGDIAISYQTIAREAVEQDKDFDHHFIHMLVHGLLHLQGYDHLTDDEAEEMEGLEIKILADMDIKNPYI